MNSGIAGFTPSMEQARERFRGASDGVYLNTAAEGLFLDSHAAALTGYAECKTRGSAGRDDRAATEARCRVLVARMLRTRPEDIAFVASTSRGLDAVIKAIDWQVGDNVVLADTEFPTTVFAATLLSQSGVERRVVRARGGETTVADFDACIDDRTRLVLASMVSYKTGYRMDIPALSAVAHKSGALLFVDAVQAFGAIPIDCNSADFICACTYKWQLGCHGLAVLYARPDAVARLEIPYVGWRGVVDLFPPGPLGTFKLYADARRFEEGMPNYPAMFVLENALTFLEEIGIDRIAAHNASLVAQAMSGLEELGLTMLTTRNPQARAGIVSFETPLAVKVTSMLGASGIHVWGKDGRVRLSAHLYNTADDIAQFIAAVGKLIREGMRLQS